MSAELERLAADAARRENWKRWGPYLSERQWGTVREDYSSGGDSWNYCSHDHARSRAYRWGEDGLLGITDRECRLCFALALWNGKDPILKERLFGLTGPEGNHGEDVKELYYYLDATPTGSYLKALYKYPQAAFPYAQLVEENRRRSKLEPEFELLDTGVFAENRYFDVTAEYAKHAPDDIFIRLTLTNRGPDPATLHVCPSCGFATPGPGAKPSSTILPVSDRGFSKRVPMVPLRPATLPWAVTGSRPVRGRTVRCPRRFLLKTRQMRPGSTAFRRAVPTTQRMLFIAIRSTGNSGP
jgi:hypothetical protein